MQRVWSTYLDESGSRAQSRDNDVLNRRSPSFIYNAKFIASPQRYILEGDSSDGRLEPPSAPFTGLPSPESPSSAVHFSPSPYSSDSANPSSLSVNFLPSKFTPLSIGLYNRKVKRADIFSKQGGGRKAFKSGEARIPGDRDNDYDGVDISQGVLKNARPLRWNRFKWTLFCANLMVTIYSLAALIASLFIWFNIWPRSDVIRVGNRTILILSTLAASSGILTSLLGWAGILLNNRGFLATYTLLLWVTFALIAAPGYIAYKTHTFNLEGKINDQWSRDLGQDGRLRIQNQLGCCGYYSPFVEATVSQLCYARSVLPGCKSAFLKFERATLARWYTIAFGLVPFHIAAILAALLCSNHVTYRFGKGMMPKAYRLSVNSMAVLMGNYASQLSEQYGKATASDLLALARSRSNAKLDYVPSLHHDQKANNNPFTNPAIPTHGRSRYPPDQDFDVAGNTEYEMKRL